MSSIPKLTQQVIEQSARILGECGTGDEITRMFQDIGIVDDSGESTKWRRINSVLWRAQQRDGNATRFIEFVQRMLAPVRYIGRSDYFKSVVEQLNQIISFDGLQYNDNGTFIRISPTMTLSAAERRANSLRVQLVNRNAHAEVLKYCTAELVANDAFHAIFEACKGVFERIRTMSGSTLDGSRLIESVFGGTMPILALNTLQTQTERDEQSGLMSLLKGCASACRNPIAHEPRVLWAGSDEDALDSLVLVSLLHKKLDRCVKTHCVNE
ncbi:MAG: TIGR02391 family protein [Kiritimatiellae bacterium]|nr:TIGR02391 family protein [Kiritimatiellia bacterium]